jgi:hypothetical protein
MVESTPLAKLASPSVFSSHSVFGGIAEPNFLLGKGSSRGSLASEFGLIPKAALKENRRLSFKVLNHYYVGADACPVKQPGGVIQM